jgi:hypothetical protein
MANDPNGNRPPFGGPPPPAGYAQPGYAPPQQQQGYGAPPAGYGAPQYPLQAPPTFGSGLGATAIPCPRCNQPTTSMKSYTMVQFMLFVWVFAFWRRQVVTCCPGCMRKEIALKTLINVIPANLLWFVIVAPWHTVLFCMTFAQGHSDRVRNVLAQRG